MDKRWSTYIQTPAEIDSHREIRFHDKYRHQILTAMGVKSGMLVADIGCGAGTLTRKLSKWLGEDSKIYGIDRDTGFIEYSIDKALGKGINNVEYINADAYSIPLPDNFLDASTSHTVIEHVDHEKFLLEQKRIVKPGGTISFMSVRPEKSIYVSYQEEKSNKENELKKLIKKAFDVKDINDIILQNPISPEEIPRLMENLGFTDISVEGIAITVSPDNAENSIEYKRAIIEAERISEMEVARKAHLLKPSVFTESHFNEIVKIIQAKAQQRTRDLEQKIRKWEYSINLMIVVKGNV